MYAIVPGNSLSILTVPAWARAAGLAGAGADAETGCSTGASISRRGGLGVLAADQPGRTDRGIA